MRKPASTVAARCASSPHRGIHSHPRPLPEARHAGGSALPTSSARAASRTRVSAELATTTQRNPQANPMRLRPRRAAHGLLPGIGDKWPRTAPLRAPQSRNPTPRSSHPSPTQWLHGSQHPRQTTRRGRSSRLLAHHPESCKKEGGRLPAPSPTNPSENPDEIPAEPCIWTFRHRRSCRSIRSRSFCDQSRS